MIAFQASQMFKGYFSEVSRVSTECFRGVSRKFQKKNQDVSKKFHIACPSSGFPEQKEEGLLEQKKIPHLKSRVIVIAGVFIFGGKMGVPPKKNCFIHFFIFIDICENSNTLQLLLNTHLILINAGGRAKSSSSIRESQFLHKQTSGRPETSV